nr:glutaminyl-peptide cyclotransferase [Sphingomonas jinjuensis]
MLLAGPATAQIPADRGRVLARLPHDRSAFTEGLLIDNGTLYESTGRDSSVRRVDLKTGRVLASAPIPNNLFGEGIVAWKGQLLSVTWHGGQGFRWTMPDLKRVGGWRYAGEGWAMTEDGRSIILSDGTPTLRFLDPVKLTVTHRLTVTADGQPLPMLNELEYVNGEILANVWMTPRIARIDPATGKVKGWIDLSALVAEVGATDRDSVPNGIAYDRRLKRLYVTGKDWPTLYQIALPH